MLDLCGFFERHVALVDYGSQVHGQIKNLLVCVNQVVTTVARLQANAVLGRTEGIAVGHVCDNQAPCCWVLRWYWCLLWGEQRPLCRPIPLAWGGVVDADSALLAM